MGDDNLEEDYRESWRWISFRYLDFAACLDILPLSLLPLFMPHADGLKIPTGDLGIDLHACFGAASS